MRRIIGRYGLSGREQVCPIKQLSDGQRCRVSFAWLAWQQPHLLLLDEPTNHLDLESIDALAEAINTFDGGMILVSHDFRLVQQVAKEIYICDKKVRTQEIASCLILFRQSPNGRETSLSSKPISRSKSRKGTKNSLSAEMHKLFTLPSSPQSYMFFLCFFVDKHFLLQRERKGASFNKCCDSWVYPSTRILQTLNPCLIYMVT